MLNIRRYLYSVHAARARKLQGTLLECPDKEERRKFLRETQGQNLDFRKLLGTEKGARVASK